ncbi:tubulin--tyrosine ligase-like protein 12 isoform X2 [Polyergus mexicanus]|uniref:tubulin--tyrosine ligase-like protein 12 isoform X2 n=1 Tax=Polyergus mexicanus TaxID=615972 RepID=UPI0038B47E44
MDGTNLFNIFLQTHRPQLQSYGVPQLLWESLYKKLKNQIFDGGLVFQLAKIEYKNEERHATEPIWKLIVSAENGISVQDPNNIYLVDHAWTYDIDIEIEEQEKIENVMREMWRYNQSYSVNYGAIEDRMPIWYVMDEVGSAINHSGEPNFRAVPFLHMPEGVIYTLLFPIKDIDAGDEITRDFVEGQTDDPQKRRVLLLPWIDSTFEDENFEQIEPDVDYFSMGHVHESLPEITDVVLKANTSKKLKVFSHYDNVINYLTDPAFEITDNQEEADILWLISHYKTYKELSLSSPHVFINQFPYENVLTIKDLLSIVCRRKAINKLYDPDTLETYPAWLPTTYNLNTELVQFVAYFTQRADKNLDNHWICKPWNLARGLDTHITNNPYHILRLPCTGPKIAQKYIARPVLYNRSADINRVKFDIRYVVLLKSVKPLRAYAYANFFLRFANIPFALNNFDVYEQHFTVMNYIEEDAPLFHLKCADFIVEWEKRYSDYPWKTYVEPKILSVLRQVFEAAIAQPPPKGIAESPQSRAVYAADLMLEWRDSEMQPKLLEINFTPDCQRACEYYPDFYNDIFKCLFLDIENPEIFHILD